MAALAAVLRLVKAGQHVVAGDDIYGGTSRLLAQIAPGLGIAVTNVDTTDIECAASETPLTLPLLCTVPCHYAELAGRGTSALLL